MLCVTCYVFVKYLEFSFRYHCSFEYMYVTLHLVGLSIDVKMWENS
jgi:hypothetical protein